MPKQFVTLVGQKSTFQQTLQRLGDPTLFAAPIVMTVGEFRFYVQHQAAEVGCSVTVVLEPERRDSGPAIATGALIARQRDPDAVVFALVADHVIVDTAAFHAVEESPAHGSPVQVPEPFEPHTPRLGLSDIPLPS
jgi:mannose-1-phosphate guanylyltransferase